MTRFAQVKTGEVWAPLLSLSSRSSKDRLLTQDEKPQEAFIPSVALHQSPGNFWMTLCGVLALPRIPSVGAVAVKTK